MPHSTVFNRAPRLQFPELDHLEIELPSPPENNQPSDFNWIVTITPLFGFGAMALFYLARSGGGSPVMLLPLLLLAGVSVGSTVLLQRWRTAHTKNQLRKRQLDYARLLDNKRVRLQAAHDAYRAILQRTYPATDELLGRALTPQSTLWERRPHDADFTYYRLGTGRIRAPFSIKSPDPDLERDGDGKLRGVIEAYRTLDHAPVVTSLQGDVSTTLIGRRAMTLGAARAMLCQLALTHAPQELQIFILAPQTAIGDWSWASWLPHVAQSDFGTAFNPNSTRNTLGYLSQLLDARRDGQGLVPHILVVIDDPQTIESERLYSILLRDGARYHASVLCFANQYESAPSDAKTLIVVDEKGRFKVQRVGVGGIEWQGEKIDTLSLTDATHIARALAPLELNESGLSGRIPSRVDFLEMYGVRTVDELPRELAKRWVRPLDGILPRAVPIGRESLTSETMLWLDEEHHGPHGVLAGTTGSGKSELLQSLVCALAIEHDPRFLTFLLIDFKGGSTFAPFVDLPHTVGIVTNLDPTQVRRMLESLKSEIEWRQQFLQDINIRDITQYHRFYATDERMLQADYRPLPHLVIIVDEFAQLAREMPEFMSELVRTAQVGRSLGLHLILGTQSPMDVITDEMNANLQFRICLRVQNAEASRAMLRRPDASYIPVGRAGRGYLQVGEQGLFKQFQASYSGADYHDRLTADETPVLELLTTSGEVIDLLHQPKHSYSQPMGEPFTVANAISEVIRHYAIQQRIALPQSLLLPPLPNRILLSRVHERIMGGCDGYRWVTPLDTQGHTIPLGSAPIGWIDDVNNRTQYPLWVHLNNGNANEGHLLIVGIPSSGKTTLLKTLALSLAVLHSPEDLHFYILSFTGTGLNSIGQLPHAERPILGTEPERVRRLFGRLMKTLDNRLSEPQEKHPYIVVFIDQYEQFRDLYRDTHMADLERLINEGRSAHIYVVIVASNINVIPDRLRAVIPQRIALQQAMPSDYTLMVGRLAHPMDAPLPQGRCFVQTSPPLLAQICLPALNPMTNHQDSGVQHALEQSVQALQEAYRLAVLGQNDPSLQVRAPEPLSELPTRVSLAQLPILKAKPAQVITPLGLSDDDRLSVFALDWWNDGSHFVVVGPPASGKTNLLHTAMLSSARQMPPSQLRFLLVDFNQRSLRLMESLKHVIYRATDVSELKVQLGHLQMELEGLQKQGGILPVTVLVVDDYDVFIDSMTNEYETLNQMRHLARFYNDVPFHIWVAGYLERTTDPFIKQLLLRRSGFGMVTRESLQRLSVRVSHLPAETMPIGRAYFPQSNDAQVVQTALIDDPVRYINQINDDRWIDYDRASWFFTGRQIGRIPHGAPIADTPDPFNLEIDTRGLIDDLLKDWRNDKPND